MCIVSLKKNKSKRFNNFLFSEGKFSELSASFNLCYAIRPLKKGKPRWGKLPMKVVNSFHAIIRS